MAKIESKFQLIDGVNVHYKTRGTGPCALLLIHGAIGSTNDFLMQLDEQMGLSGDQFTLVAYDMPGLGRSNLEQEPEEPIKCEPTLEYFEWAAELGAKLMANLHFKTYAVGGWSDGARVASLLAIKQQSRVDALVLWSFLSKSEPQSAGAIARTRDTSTWEPAVLENYTKVYGDSEFGELWRQYVDFTIKSLDNPEMEPFDISDKLKAIKCPTLIINGNLDPIVSYDKHVKPLEMQIYDSEIVQFKDAAHNLHQAHPRSFNQMLSSFVTSVKVSA